jgi:hypothetical protein
MNSQITQTHECLAHAEIARDNLLAKVADLECERRALGDPIHWQEAWEKRKLRREHEQKRISRGEQQHLIPPGPWDWDLDTNMNKEYIEAQDGGYDIVLRRSPVWTWNVYVRLPHGHCCEGGNEDMFSHDRIDGMPTSEFDFTWAKWMPIRSLDDRIHEEDDDDEHEPAKKFEFGIDHNHWHDVKPYRVHTGWDQLSRRWQDDCNKAANIHNYITMGEAMVEGRQMVAFFRLVEANRQVVLAYKASKAHLVTEEW